MYEVADGALGVSVGTTNLVATRPGLPPVSRRSVLTLWENRPADVGVPSQNPDLTSPNLTASRVVLRGFVERVGDPVPLVGADGSAYQGEALLATAVEAMVRVAATGAIPGPVTVAVPAYWGPATVGALRGALRGVPTLSRGGVPPTIISDADAALAALRANPGLPHHGVVALCDFGGSGSSLTFADAGAAFAPISDTARFADFSGERIDQALLSQLLAMLRPGSPDETSGTAAVGPLTRLREECRLAKERLSAETATVVPVDLPGVRTDVRLTRRELEEAVAPSLSSFLDFLGDALERNRIPGADLTAVAIVGGGASIPVVAQRLSETLRVPVVSGPDPGSTAAIGAAHLGSSRMAPDAPTSTALPPADAATSVAPTAWASGTAGQAATESASDGSPSATYRALAWSQDDDATAEPAPYAGEDYPSAPYSGEDYRTGDPYAGTDQRPAMDFDTDGHDPTGAVPPLLPWYRRPALLFGVAATLAAVAVGGLAIKLTGDTTPTTSTTRVSSPSSGPPPPPPTTTTITGSNGQTTVTTITTTTTAAPTSDATTTTTPPTTTTTTTVPTTTTTTAPTTTTTTTTTPPTTTTTTTTPVTTTTQPPTTTGAPPTTTAAPPPTSSAAPPITTTAAPPPTTQEAAPAEADPTAPAG